MTLFVIVNPLLSMHHDRHTRRTLTYVQTGINASVHASSLYSQCLINICRSKSCPRMPKPLNLRCILRSLRKASV